MRSSTRLSLVVVALMAAGCHHAPPSTGPHNLRSAAECAPIVAEVLADTALRATLRASAVTLFLPPLPVPPRARGLTAQIWAPVDEQGRVRGEVRVVGMPDAAYVRDLRRTVAKASWRPAVRDDCWVPGWGYLTYTF